MEHLRRKERDTSATDSEEGTLMVRTKLRPFLLREDLVARGRLQGELSEWLVVDDGHAGCGEAAGARVLFDAGIDFIDRYNRSEVDEVPSDYLGAWRPENEPR